MKLTSKIQYGLKIALRVARQTEDAEPISISDIALSEKIPFNYTSLLARKLKCAHILESHRGAQGGYTLARRPEQIPVADVLRALDGFSGFLPEEIVQTGQASSPDEMFWHHLDQTVRTMMDSVTLRDLLKTKSEQDISAVISRASKPF